MIDVQLLRTQLDEVAARLAARGAAFDREAFRALEAERKDIQTRTQDLQSARNAHAKKVGQAKSRGEDTTVLVAEASGINRELGELEARLSEAQRQLNDFLAGVPNLPHPSVPVGRSEADNVEQRRWGAPRHFDFPVKDHVDLGEGLGQLDFATGSKISGSRFVLMRGPLARLHRAIAQFMLDLHSGEHGYKEIYAPYLVNAQSMYGTGQLPKFEQDLFIVPRGDEKWYLIPTAEVPVTNIVRDAIVAGESLPMFSFRGGIVWQGHARHDSPAPVRQGRAGPDRAARGLL
jgi:seryl-tRNA synthetase